MARYGVHAILSWLAYLSVVGLFNGWLIFQWSADLSMVG
jgi:hypothetical protein